MSDAFDWIAFFEARGIEFVLSGPNIGRGEVGIKCPFCGPSDPSHHMSINLEGRGWICRRNRASHRGRAPAQLIRALTGCTAEQARQIVGVAAQPVGGDLLAQVESLVGGAADVLPPAGESELTELASFKRFDTSRPSARPFFRYLEGRGFSPDFLERASRQMGLRYCVAGPFAGRVIFLIRVGGQLVSWTGRSISAQPFLRYRALSADPDKAAEDELPVARRSIEQCLLWYDELLRGGDALYLVEGPLDALKLRALGQAATCLFTNSPSHGQVDLLRDLAPRFSRKIILLDHGAEAQALEASNVLAALEFKPAWLPAGTDDPGELTARTFRQIAY